MKIKLTQELVLRLRIESKPVSRGAEGNLEFEDNPSRVPYVIFDEHRTSPVGFGVKVSATKKTYIIQKKAHGRVIKSKVGDLREMRLDQAREKATALARQIKESGQNPNVTSRRRSASEITLGEVMDRYRSHLVGRAKPARPNTLKVFDRAQRDFEDWKGKKLNTLDANEIVKRFDSRAEKYRTATEQIFRWASVSVEHAIKLEALNAQIRAEQPKLHVNPFRILQLTDRYRDRQQLELERENSGARNPLSARDTLGKFLEALWSKRRTNNTRAGCHYLLLMLLWGCRKSEHAPVVWSESVPHESERSVSHVNIDGGYVFFHRTKNGRNHKLPLTRCAKALLELRREAAARETLAHGFDDVRRRFVFPAKSKRSNSGHYSDAQDLLARLRDEAKLDRLTRHDLRRTFGRVCDEIGVPKTVTKRLLNHAKSEATDFYTEPEWQFVQEWMQKIEDTVLMAAPNVYNALRPADFPPLPAPEPHRLTPVKPRSGRPRKTVQET